jgi:integrase
VARWEYLTEKEVEKLIAPAKANRNGHCDGTMILIAFRHGLRAVEVCDLRWDQVEFSAGRLHVRRRKNGAERPSAQRPRAAGPSPATA